MNIIKISEIESKPGSSVELVKQIAKTMIPAEGCAAAPISEPNLQKGWQTLADFICQFVAF